LISIKAELIDICYTGKNKEVRKVTLITTLIMVALIATIISLAWGVGSMAHGGRFDTKHSTHFMSARVILQGVVVVLMLVAFIMSAS